MASSSDSSAKLHGYRRLAPLASPSGKRRHRSYIPADESITDSDEADTSSAGPSPKRLRLVEQVHVDSEYESTDKEESVASDDGMHMGVNCMLSVTKY